MHWAEQNTERPPACSFTGNRLRLRRAVWHNLEQPRMSMVASKVSSVAKTTMKLLNVQKYQQCMHGEFVAVYWHFRHCVETLIGQVMYGCMCIGAVSQTRYMAETMVAFVCLDSGNEPSSRMTELNGKAI